MSKKPTFESFAKRLSEAYWEITDNLPADQKKLVRRPAPEKDIDYAEVLEPLLDIIGDLYSAEQARKEKLEETCIQQKDRISWVVAEFLYRENYHISFDTPTSQISHRIIEITQNNALFRTQADTLSFRIYDALKIPYKTPEWYKEGFQLLQP